MKTYQPLRFSLSLMLLCGSFASLAEAQTPRRYEASFTRTAPAIDGVVTAGEWDDAAVADDWHVLRTPEETRSTHNDRWRLLWDDEALYLLYESDYTGWSPAGADGEIAGAGVQGIDFNTDNINLYIDPNTDGESLFRDQEGEAVDGYQIAWNLLSGEGSLSGGSFTNSGFFLEAHVNNAFGNQGSWGSVDPILPRSEVAQTLGAGGGVVEFKLVWQDLDAPGLMDDPATPDVDEGDTSVYHPMAPEIDDVWIWNVCRITSDAANFLPIWSWQPEQSFALPPHGELVFIGQNDTARFGTVGNGGVYEQSFNLENISETDTVTITGITPAAVDPGRTDLFEILSFPTELAPGASGPVTMRFSPGLDVVGDVLAAFDVASDAVDEAVVPQVFGKAFVVNGNGLAARYQLDETEGTVVTDSAGLGPEGAFNGGPTLGAEALASGTSVNFTGTSFGSVPAEDLPKGDFSVSLWANVESVSGETGFGVLFGFDELEGATALAATADGNLQWFVASEPAFGTETGDAIALGSTHHIVTTYAGGDSPTVAIYVDGVEVIRQSDLEPLDQGSDATFLFGAFNGTLEMNGRLDDIQIYDRAISMDEVGFLQANPGDVLPVPGSGPTDPTRVGLAIRAFTGGDAGEGLDLDGEFLYAINMLGAGLTIRDAVFTMDDVAGFTHDFVNAAPNWHPTVAYGDTTDDDNLEAVMRDIRWSVGADGPAQMTLANLEPGQAYKLQLLFAEACCDRGWDILLDGVPSAENFNVQRIQGGIGNPGAGAVLTYSFIPQVAETTIQFQQSATPFADNNPILQGLTLETVTDTDGDGLDDDLEMAAFGDLAQTADGDLDNDGLDNYVEIVGGTDPTVDADADADGLTDAQEILTHGTDPNNADSDGDGLSDGDEVNTHGTDPSLADTDGDGLNDNDEVTTHGTDPLVADTDDDGFSDGLEIARGSNAASASDTPPYLAYFTGGDIGEGLDLDGEFVYAINMRGPGVLQVRDALFTDDTVAGFAYDQPNEILAWHAPAYGGSANDDNLEMVMQSIRWNAGPVVMTLGGLTPGETYKLQLLFAENCCNRGWDIAVEGELILDDFNIPLLQNGINNTARGAAVVYEFVATDDTLEIDFINDAPIYPDNNPILNGLTLEVNSDPILQDVTSPGDAIELVSGENDGDADEGPPPGAEGVENAINDVSQKYLNFLDLNSGFIVTPSAGSSVVTRLRVYTANDAVERDPSSYQLAGSTSGPGGPFTVIAEGDLALPDDRNGSGTEPINAERFHQEVVFENGEAYTSYRLIFPTLKDAGAANSMQIAEVELIGYVIGADTTNLIVNGSFEEPVLENINTNNLGVVPTGWSQTGTPDTWNMIRNDGSPYGSGVDTAADGSQIVDLNGVFTMFQNFTLDEPASLVFGASFANREGHDGSDPSTVGIYSADGSELLSPLVTVDTSADPTPSEVWRSGEATVMDLPAGEYQVRIALNNFNNADAVYVRIAPDGPVDGDADGDGVSDALEAIAGTDPNDPFSYLRVTETGFDGANPVITWSAVDGKTYNIEYSTDLQTWTQVNVDPIAGADGVGSFTDTDPERNGNPLGFYRAVVVE